MLTNEFQERVKLWVITCFGYDIAMNRIERNFRFLEESLELVQSNGCTCNEAHKIVNYVYNRPSGELEQEVGGVMVTLAALCLASELNMHNAGEIELKRAWEVIDKIRAKQVAKPNFTE